MGEPLDLEKIKRSVKILPPLMIGVLIIMLLEIIILIYQLSDGIFTLWDLVFPLFQFILGAVMIWIGYLTYKSQKLKLQT